MAEKEIIDSEVNYYVKSSTEKKSIPNFLVDENDINIRWPDDHETTISLKDIKSLKKPRKPEKKLWTKNFIPKYYDWDDFLENNDIAISAISEFIIYN